MEPREAREPSEAGVDEEATMLLARADVARSRLFAALSALDRRRRHSIAQVTRPLEFLPVLAIGCVAGLLAVVAYRAAARRRRGEERWRMLQRVWTHPERLARPERTIVADVARAALVGAARLLVARLATGPSYRETPRAMT
jgi:hypothetical protein